MKTRYIIAIFLFTFINVHVFAIELNDLANLQQKVKEVSLLDSLTYDSKKAIELQKLYEVEMINIVNLILADYPKNRSKFIVLLSDPSLKRDMIFYVLRNKADYNLKNDEIKDIFISILNATANDNADIDYSIRLLLKNNDVKLLKSEDVAKFLPIITKHDIPILSILFADLLYDNSEYAREYLQKCAIGYDAPDATEAQIIAKAFWVKHSGDYKKFNEYIKQTRVNRTNIGVLPTALGISKNSGSIKIIVSMLNSNIRFDNGDDAIPQYESLSREAATVLSLLLQGFPQYNRNSKFDKLDQAKCIQWTQKNMISKMKINEITYNYIINRFCY